MPYLDGSGNAVLASPPGAGAHANLLLNGGMALAQRQAPGTLTTVASDKYSADRWRVSSQTASVQYVRTDTTGAAESGITARYYGTWKQITNSGKFAVAQPLEASPAIDLAGQTVAFQIKLKASTAKTIRLGLLAWAGTVDTLPNALVSAWNSDTTDPTWTTNLSLVGSAVSCAVTTAWQNFSASFTLPAAGTYANLVPVLWTDSAFAANDALSATEAGLYAGAAPSAWAPRPPGQEFALCQRYYEKSYPPDVVPGTSVLPDAVIFMLPPGGTDYCIFPNRFRAAKRAAPTVTLWDYAGNIGKGTYETANGVGSDNQTLGAGGVGLSSFYAYSDNATNKLGLLYHWSAECEL